MSERNDRFEIRHDRLTGETVYYTTHTTGVKIAICPKPEHHSSYAVFGAKYGSIDNDFSVDGGEFTRVPDGIAHYLEHKLFENEDCGAFERFAKTGACANAFTSFDRTCYFFSCTSNFDQSLEILLDFVQKPYFTEETVCKEQGIIAQEIGMYRDSPNWLVFFSLMKAMYREHPIRNDIAGTVESIAQITPELLYTCYCTFYNPSNMALTVCGKVDPNRVMEICDCMLLPNETQDIVSRCPEDDGRIVESYTEHEFDVPVPIFQLGFKEKYGRLTERDRVLASIVRKAVFGPSTDFYNRMVQKKLINNAFGGDYIYLRGVQATVFQGMSDSPEALRDEIFEEIERVTRDGISPRLFECARRGSYGGQIALYDSADDIADNLWDDVMFGSDSFEALQAVTQITLDEANEKFRHLFDITNSSLSVVRRHKEA